MSADTLTCHSQVLFYHYLPNTAVVTYKNMEDDKTKRKRKLANLSSYPEMNPTPVLEIDLDGTVTYVNPAGRRLFPDLSESGLQHPYLASVQIIAGQLREQGRTSHEREIKVGDACYTQVLYYMKTERRMRVFGFDITGHKQAEEALKAEKAKLELLFNSMSEGSAHYEAIRDERGVISDLRVLEINQAGATLSGVKREDQIGKTWRQVWPNVPEDVFEPYRKVERVGKASSFEQHSPITERWYIVNICKVDAARFAVTFSDITERKQIEESLARERDLLQSVMNSAGKAHLAYLDRDFNFVRVNETLAVTCGYRPEEMIGKNHFALYPHAENEAIFRRVRDTGKPFEICDKPFEFPGQPERGVTYWDWTLIPAKDVGGQVTGLILSSFETTARVRAEEALHQLNASLEQRITERKQTEAALQESERGLRALFEQAGVGVAQIDSWTGQFVRVNNRYAAIVGYTPQEMLLMTFQAITHPDDLGADLNNMERLRTGKIRQFSMEKRYQRKQGSIVWVNLTVSPLWLPGEKPRYHIAVVEDITERKQAEAALRELNATLEQRVTERTAALRASEERLRRVSDNASVGLNRCSRDWVYLSANPAYAELAGKPLDQIVGRPIIEVMGAAAVETIRPYVKRVLRGEHVTYEAKVSFAAAGQRYLHVSYTPDTDATGKIVGWVACVTDITARKQAEESLRESEARFRKIFDFAADGLFVHDLTAGKLHLANKTCLEMLGYTLEEFKKLDVPDLHPAEALPFIQGEIAKAMRGEAMPTRELPFRRKDGTVIITELKPTSIALEGRTYALVSVRDITERKKTEEEMRLKHEQLLLTTKQLSETEERERKHIAEELHDRIGQNLNAIGLNLDILRSEMVSSENIVLSRIDDAIALLEQTTERTRNLMAELRPPGLDDFGLVASLKWLVKSFSERTEIEVDVNADETIPRLDPEREILIFRIIQEALNNISKHAHATYVDITITSEDDIITIIVSDNGIGFEPAAIMTAQGLKGSGIMHMMERARIVGGKCRIESNPGDGASVVMEFPR